MTAALAWSIAVVVVAVLGIVATVVVRFARWLRPILAAFHLAQQDEPNRGFEPGEM